MLERVMTEHDPPLPDTNKSWCLPPGTPQRSRGRPIWVLYGIRLWGRGSGYCGHPPKSSLLVHIHPSPPDLRRENYGGSCGWWRGKSDVGLGKTHCNWGCWVNGFLMDNQTWPVGWVWVWMPLTVGLQVLSLNSSLQVNMGTLPNISALLKPGVCTNRGGCPRTHWKSVRPIEEWIREFWAHLLIQLSYLAVRLQLITWGWAKMNS